MLRRKHNLHFKTVSQSFFASESKRKIEKISWRSKSIPDNWMQFEDVLRIGKISLLHMSQYGPLALVWLLVRKWHKKRTQKSDNGSEKTSMMTLLKESESFTVAPSMIRMQRLWLKNQISTASWLEVPPWSQPSQPSLRHAKITWMLNKPMKMRSTEALAPASPCSCQTTSIDDPTFDVKK